MCRELDRKTKRIARNLSSTNRKQVNNLYARQANMLCAISVCVCVCEMCHTITAQIFTHQSEIAAAVNVDCSCTGQCIQ